MGKNKKEKPKQAEVIPDNDPDALKVIYPSILYQYKNNHHQVLTNFRIWVTKRTVKANTSRRFSSTQKLLR